MNIQLLTHTHNAFTIYTHASYIMYSTGGAIQDLVGKFHCYCILLLGCRADQCTLSELLHLMSI